jgi:hypothetical protein
LKIFVAHLFVVLPRWVVLGKIVGKVELSGSPEEIELALADAILHPPIAHVERLGELLAHFGVEDALGGVVVGFEGGAGDP